MIVMKTCIQVSSTMMKPVVFVIGATGTIGSATVAALAEKYADKVEIRAGVRNPDKADKLRAIAGITIVKAEMGKKDELVNTFKGVNALYIVTPAVQNQAELAIATAETAEEAGVKAVVVVSLLIAGLTKTVFGRNFMEIEDTISKLRVPYTFLRLPLFVENYWAFKDSIVGQSTIYSPVDPTKPFTPVVVEDAGKAAAVIFVYPTKHANKTYNIVSDRHTFGEVTDTFSLALGKELTYVHVSYDSAKRAFLEKRFPDCLVDEIMDTYKLIDSGSQLTNTADLSAFFQITGEQPTSLKAWLVRYSRGFQGRDFSISSKFSGDFSLQGLTDIDTYIDKILN